MQYRDFLFRNNPASITVTQGDRTAALLCPGRGEVVQRLGNAARTVRCEGAFFGGTFEEAAAQLEDFRRRAAGEGPGSLFLPGQAPFLAHLREFVYEAAGDGCILPYTMVFVEAEVVA